MLWVLRRRFWSVLESSAASVGLAADSVGRDCALAVRCCPFVIRGSEFELNSEAMLASDGDMIAAVPMAACTALERSDSNAAGSCPAASIMCDRMRCIDMARRISRDSGDLGILSSGGDAILAR